MAFPAPLDSDVGSVGGADPAGPDNAVEVGNLVDLSEGDDNPAKAPGVDVDLTGVRDGLGDDPYDVLNKAASGRQLQLASLGVLPELAELPEREAAYARAARAANTLRGYRSDWADFTTWCTAHDAVPMPATPSALTGYLVALAQAGAKVGTLSRRLSSIRFAHASAGHPDPATHPHVMAVWEASAASTAPRRSRRRR